MSSLSITHSTGLPKARRRRTDKPQPMTPLVVGNTLRHHVPNRSREPPWSNGSYDNTRTASKTAHIQQLSIRHLHRLSLLDVPSSVYLKRRYHSRARTTFSMLSGEGCRCLRRSPYPRSLHTSNRKSLHPTRATCYM